MLRQRLYAAGQDTVCKKSKCDILTRHVPQDEAVRTTGQKAIEISSLLSPPPRSPHLGGERICLCRAGDGIRVGRFDSERCGHR